MAEMFWPTHELLEIPAGGRKVKVELHGLLLLKFIADRKAAIAETNWATRRPLLVSRLTAEVIGDAPLYVTEGSLRKLWKAKLLTWDESDLDDRLLELFLASMPFDPERSFAKGPRVDVFVPSASGLAEVEANRARLDGEMRLGLARPELHVVVAAERASDGTAVGTGPLCAVLRDRGGELDVRVVALPPGGSRGLIFGGEVDKVRRPAVALWDTDRAEWEGLLAAEAARRAETDAEAEEHARRVDAEIRRHGEAVAAAEGRWRAAVEAATGEAPAVVPLPRTGR